MSSTAMEDVPQLERWNLLSYCINIIYMKISPFSIVS